MQKHQWNFNSGEKEHKNVPVTRYFFFGAWKFSRVLLAMRKRSFDNNEERRPDGIFEKKSPGLFLKKIGKLRSSCKKIG